MAHTIRSKGLTKLQRMKLERMYQKRDNKKQEFVTDYASADSTEYFAESTGAYLGADATTNRGAVRIADETGLGPSIPFEDSLSDLAARPGELLAVRKTWSALERRSLDGEALALWPAVGCLGKLLFRGDAAVTAEGPVRRPTGLGGAPRLAYGHDGDLRVIWNGTELARLDGEGDLVWETEIPDAIISIQPPAAAPDGTTYGVFMCGQEEPVNRLVRVLPDGNYDDVVFQADHLAGCACDEAGRVWTYGGDHEDGVGGHHALLCYDARGVLVWRGAAR